MYLCTGILAWLDTKKHLKYNCKGEKAQFDARI